MDSSSNKNCVSNLSITSVIGKGINYSCRPANCPGLTRTVLFFHSCPGRPGQALKCPGFLINLLKANEHFGQLNSIHKVVSNQAAHKKKSVSCAAGG